MKKCPVCGVMMGDNVARCSMCKYDFQKASGGDADAAIAEAQQVLTKKEEENLARTEAKRTEEEKHLAAIREKINREIATLTAQFESEKLRLDSEYATLQKQAIDEKLKLEQELNDTRSEVEKERAKIIEARAAGDKARQEKIDEGQAKYDEMIRLAEEEQQKMISAAQEEINAAASKIDAEYAEVLKKRDILVAEATEAQTFLENFESVKKDYEAQQQEQESAIAAKKAELEKLERDGKEIMEKQASEAIKAKEVAESELAQIVAERDTIVAGIEAQQQQAQLEIEQIKVQAEQVIAEAEEAAKRRDDVLAEVANQKSEIEKIAIEADKIVAQKEALEADIAKEQEAMEAKRREYDEQMKDYEAQATEWGNQIEAIKGDYDQATRIIEDSKTIEVHARAAAEEIILDAEKRAVFLKEVALKESDKGQFLKEIEEKEQQIKAMEKERDDLNEKIKSLEASIADIQKKAASGAFGGSDYGPKEYCVDVVKHTSASEVDADGITSVLQKRSADGWKLTSVINDDGAKIQNSLGDSSTASLAVGAYSSKVDQVVLIFERPRKK